MSDNPNLRALERRVLQVEPPLEEGASDQARHFASYLQEANLVLLGDPGAGKSYLFRAASEVEGGQFLTARDFLNLPPAHLQDVLFIDALDEQRAGRHDHGIVNAIVQKLFECAPRKVRISCRIADWLGDTDFAAFRTYFDRHGAAKVLQLAPLVADEQRSVLEHSAIENPEAFIEEAEKRGLGEFLLNPQTLLMLGEVVATNAWPTSKKELFHGAAKSLLQESNRNKTSTESGKFSPEELFEAAGKICALRLLSELEGICLADASTDQRFPSYRSLDFNDSLHVRAALTRRAFVAKGVDRVDYVHRTVAEYLASQFIAKQMKQGLPIERVFALLGVQGKPASSLRVLNAWLAVHVDSHSWRFIDADPYGVLIYGDVGALSTSSLAHLLKALGRLSEKNPWFHDKHIEASNLRPFAKPDMVEDLRAILRDPQAALSLRLLTLDAIASGDPLSDLEQDLTSILVNETRTHAERARAVAGLAKLGAPSRRRLSDLYRTNRMVDEDSLYLRAEVISVSLEHEIDSGVVAALFDDILAVDCDLPSGILRPIAMAVPLEKAPQILDLAAKALDELPDHQGPKNLGEVLFFLERLLLRFLQESQHLASDAYVSRVLTWLRVRYKHKHHSIIYNERLSKAVAKHQHLVDQIVSGFVIAIGEKGVIAEKNARVRSVFEFPFLMQNAVTHDALANKIIQQLEKENENSEAETILYECALSLVNAAPSLFDKVYEIAEKRPYLQEIRTSHLFCVVDKHHLEFAKREVTRKSKNAALREKNSGYFAKQRNAVRQGQDLKALAWAARVYLGFDSQDRHLTADAKLVATLGEDNAEAVLEGFSAILRRTDLPPAAYVLALCTQEKVYEWWYAIVAGLDNLIRRGNPLNEWSDSFIATLLAIRVCYPSPIYKESDAHTGQEDWLPTLLRDRREVSIATLTEIVRAHLESGATHVSGLDLILSDELLLLDQPEIFSGFLRDFPNAHPHVLQGLMCAFLRAGMTSRSKLLEEARNTLERFSLSDKARDLWLSFGFLLDPIEFRDSFKKLAEERRELLWAFRDLVEFRHLHSGPDVMNWLDVASLEMLVLSFGAQFPSVSPPVSSWGADYPFEGTQQVRKFIGALSTKPTAEAAKALSRLSEQASLASYRNEILHVRDDQQRLRIDACYKQPTLQEVAAALENREPANHLDLLALTMAHLRDIARYIIDGNTDSFKSFWNVDSHRRTADRRPEEDCRDRLLEMLRPKLAPLGITAEPESHLAQDRRVDITVTFNSMKIVIELKRDTNADVWTAPGDQLRAYVQDPEAGGYGIYGVFWFGGEYQAEIPLCQPGSRPDSAEEMEKMLISAASMSNDGKIEYIVFNVSDPKRKSR